MFKLIGWLLVGAGFALIIPVMSFLALSAVFGFICYCIYECSKIDDDDD